jgi:hypothetical protein
MGQGRGAQARRGGLRANFRQAGGIGTATSAAFQRLRGRRGRLTAQIERARQNNVRRARPRARVR